MPASCILVSARPFIWRAMLCRELSAVRRLFRRFVISLRALTECSSSFPFTPLSLSCTLTRPQTRCTAAQLHASQSAHR